MTGFLDPIRPTVRAVIIRDGDVLVQVKQKPGMKPYLTLPGGRQEPGETMAETVGRECLEEIGAQVIVGGLLHVAEVFKRKQGNIRHQVEMLFACQVDRDYVPKLGHHPDRSQVATLWASLRAPPAEFRPDFAPHLKDSSAPTYLGVFDG